MADIEITFLGDKANLLGETEEGTAFIDRFFPTGSYFVVDSGNINIEVDEVENFVKLAKAEGLFVRTIE